MQMPLTPVSQPTALEVRSKMRDAASLRHAFITLGAAGVTGQQVYDLRDWEPWQVMIIHAVFGGPIEVPEIRVTHGWARLSAVTTMKAALVMEQRYCYRTHHYEFYDVASEYCYGCHRHHS